MHHITTEQDSMKESLIGLIEMLKFLYAEFLIPHLQPLLKPVKDI